MNLYGWSFQAFCDVLGSKNQSVLKAATAQLSECLSDEADLARGKAWLRILIEDGHPFNKDRERPVPPTDGGLLTMQMETAAHIYGIHCIARAIARDDHLDLSMDSSSWSRPAVYNLWQELGDCRFTIKGGLPRDYYSWMVRFADGLPLFGDDFRTNWEFYSCFTNEELAGIIPIFKAASSFERKLPESFSEEDKAGMPSSLSEGGKRLINDLIKWFSQIQEAGQDAFIIWW
jgi:hypothetical protein